MRRPSRWMWMRSATSKTCGMLWLISTIGRPRCFTSSISSSTLRDSLTPSAAVGSSMMTTRLPKAAARATATPWRWPPDSVSTGWLMFWMVSRPSSFSCSRASLLHRRRGRACGTHCPSEPGLRAARGRGTCCRRSTAPATAPGSGRRSRCRRARASIGERKCTGLPSSRISPASGMTAPASALISVDLPAPLSPMTAEDLARHQVEIGVVERDDAAVALDQAARLQDRARPWHAALMPTPSGSTGRCATATMISTPTVNSCQSTSSAGERQAVAEHADDQRADQRADDRAAAAEQAGAADHHGGDRIEVGGLRRPAG